MTDDEIRGLGERFEAVLLQEETTHKNILAGTSGQSTDYEIGFLKGIAHVRINLLPPFLGSQSEAQFDRVDKAGCPYCGEFGCSCYGGDSNDEDDAPDAS